MNLKTAILIGICIPPLCLATQQPPFAGECALIDRVSDVALQRSPTGEAALRILQLVAAWPDAVI